METERTWNILVVDDELENAELLKRRLSRLGYEVSTSSSAAEAKASIALQRPDLLLLDVWMPEVTGLELLAELRDDPVTSSLPVILVSALADTDDIVRGFRAGANDYVTKPIDMPVLLARMEAQLKGAVMLKSSQRQAELLSKLASVDEALVQTLVEEVALAKSSGSQEPEAPAESGVWEVAPTVKCPTPEEARSTGDYFAVEDLHESRDYGTVERTLFDVLEIEVGRSIAGHRPLSVLVLEPDQIAELKETHGREVGLELAGNFVQRIAGVLNRRAALYRYHGMMFCAVLLKADTERALRIAADIVSAVTSHPFKTGRGEFSFGVSVGLATLAPEHDSSPLELFERAYSAHEKARTAVQGPIWVAHRAGVLLPVDGLASPRE